MYPQYEIRSSALSLLNPSPFLSYPPRFHKELEIGFVTAGELTLSIEQKSYALFPGDLYLAFPNSIHSTQASPASGIVAIADLSLFPAQREFLIHQKLRTPIFRKDELPEAIPQLFFRLQQLSRKKEVPLSLCSGYLGAILGEALLLGEAVSRFDQGDLIPRLMQYLLEHYTEPILLEQVSRELNYSKWYVSQAIASTFGCNFRFLLNSYRISLAQSLLLSSSRSVSEVAYECGFLNQSSFNRIFLSMVGTSPTQFRNEGGISLSEPEIIYR